MLLQTVHWGDVVTGYPALSILRLGFTPFPIMIVAQDPELFTLAQEEMYLDTANTGAEGKDRFFLANRPLNYLL